MASLQNAPVMAQRLAPLPPNFTNQQAQELFQKWQRMKEQNVPPDNPEFVKTRNMLYAVNHHNQMRKQQDALARQRQAQAQSQAQSQYQDGNAISDGLNGQGPAASAAPRPVLSGSNSAEAVPSVSGGAGDQKQVPNIPANFTAEQVGILRHQILAFKMLSKNLPVPPGSQQILFGSHQTKQPLTPTQAAVSASQTPEPAVRGIRGGDAVAPSAHLRHMYDTFDSPYRVPIDLRKGISYTDHCFRVKRPLMSSILPSGVDADRVREERERAIYNRIQARKAELEGLPAITAMWNTGQGDTPVLDESSDLKAKIEYKMLSLLPKQKALRLQVSQDMVHYDNLAQTANRSIYRRLKKQSLREARITEKLEKQQRDARETKERKKQTDHIQAILHHGKEIRDNAVTQKARVQKLGRMMQSHHQQIEKEEQKRVERTAKQRLQALKNDDEATYLKLLGQAKDSRISHLLKQTDGFLNQLATSVKQQQRSAAERYGHDDPPEEGFSDDDGDGEGGPKVDYYQVAHRIKEEVKAQPSILVGGTLKEYQIKGLQWMISLYNNNLNGILADEMGLGKTIQTISLIAYLIEHKKQNGPFLVVVPLSTLTNWNLEFEKWAPSVVRIVYKGPPNARKQQQSQIRYGSFQVLLTTYEYVIRDRPVLSKIRWVHMIIDEGHRMKNTQSKLTSTLTQYYHTRYRLILTGTPLQNNLPELWALLNFALPTIFKSVQSFDEWFNTPFANTGAQDKMELTEEEQLLVIRRLHKVLRPFLLRRLKKDVEKDLPDKLERVIKCRFSVLQTKLYQQLIKNNQLAVSDGKGGKTSMRGLSNMMMQMRKLCNHPFVFEQVEDECNPRRDNNDLLWRAAGKFELLDRILPKFQATGHRILMFFQMTQIMNIMEDFLRLKGMQYLRLDGSTKSDDRSELLRIFNAPNSPYFCFLLSTRAGGLGLNLQTADTVIIYDSDWNPFQDLQAQDRAHRIGQKNEVRILRLISSNSIEEKILEKARFKLNMDDKVIQAGKFDNKTTNEERETLLRALLDSAEAAEALNDQEEMDDDDLNTTMARSEDEMRIFQQFDAERAKDPIYGPGKRLPRLMGESEVPDIYLNADAPIKDPGEDFLGRGARERTRVKYDDGLTEEQWLMAVDDDEDTIEDAIARKNARIDKRVNNKERRGKVTSGVESSPSASRPSSEEPLPRKRGRKLNPPKRKADEEIEETPARKPAKRGRNSKVQETLSPAERKELQKVLDNVFNYLMDLEEEIPPQGSDSGSSPVMRALIDPFIKPVPRSQYPHYYVIIQQPIAMDNIGKKINRNEYQSLREFRDDIKLLFDNARLFNDDDSMLFKDANKIEAAAVAKLRSETADKPDLQSFDDSAPSSTGNATPVTGNPKLKLTFNNGGGGGGGANGVYTNGADSDDDDDDENNDDDDDDD